MKIIFASKFYYRRGGLESYLFNTKKLLESYGHEVIPFSTDFHQNYDSEYSKYFCSYQDLSKVGRSKSRMKNIRATMKMFYNKEAYENMKKLIKDTKPDIVQGFGVTKHLTYSIFKAAKEMGIPTIMRLSDYAILCPNSTATDGAGEICSEFSCAKSDFIKAVKKKCIQDSTMASIIGKLEVKTNLLLNVYKKYVDYFIAPSRFIRNTFIDHLKISPQRIYYLPIYIDPKNILPVKYENNYYLFAGRLSKEKGIYTLLRAVAKNRKDKLIIAGSGPEEGNLKKYVETNNINAEFVGFQNFESLQNLIVKCTAVIVPSEWYENSPNIVLEAYGHGKPVIGSRIGGIPELIEDGKTGFLFEMGNVDDLTRKLSLINGNKSLLTEMGRNAKKKILEKFNPEDHYMNLLSIYESSVKKKVLLVNNFYYNRGGDCTYLFGLKHLLEKNKHNVVVFSMHHPKNKASTWSKYFVNYINYDEEVKNINVRSAVRVASRTIFFSKAKKMIEKLIREEKPDIAHLQNIHHHITPSILYALKKNKIPVVWTLHDYQLICPNISFVAHNKICERCKNHRYYWPPIIRCKKGSFAASLMSSIEIVIHNIVGIHRLVNLYIAPSQFLKEKFIEFGFNKDKIIHINHFIDDDYNSAIGASGDYYLFVGRISEEKGVKTLIDAAIKLNLAKLKIVGGGPLLEEMISYTKTKNGNSLIDFTGHKSRKEIYDLLSRCKFLVVPSEWYEPSGLVILEAYACQKPVIASRIGGITELIRENETGLTFETGNVVDLHNKIEYLLNNPGEAERMGQNGKKLLERELNQERYYHSILKVYREVSQ